MQAAGIYWLECRIGRLLLMQAAQGLLEYLPGRRLARPCLAHKHVAMSCHLAVMDLDDLCDQLWDDLFTKHSLLPSCMRRNAFDTSLFHSSNICIICSASE